MRLIWLLLLQTFLLFAATDQEVLDRAATLTKSASKSEVFRAYNDYKNLYLRAVMNQDDTLKKQTLQGIVITGKKLRIDIEKYKKELDTLSLEKTQAPPATSKAIKATSPVQIKEVSHLEKSYWDGNRLIFDFDGTLQPKQVNHFKILDAKKKSYRYIFDIKAAMHRSVHLQHKNIDSIRVAQYDHDTLRLVLENSTPLKLSYTIEASHLVIQPNVGEAGVTSEPKSHFKPAKPYVVVLDPGHGGKDTGAIGYKNYREKIVVFQIATFVAKRLREAGITVHLTRNRDTFISLRKRTKYANDQKADLFVSIHANSVPKKSAHLAKGIETYFLSPSRSDRANQVAAVENSKEIEDMNYFGKNNFLNFLNREKIVASNKLAIDIQRGMLSTLQEKYSDVKDNGVREGPFWVLVGAQMPAVLVEVGFISHSDEARHLVNSGYQKILAEGLAEGIIRYFVQNP